MLWNWKEWNAVLIFQPHSIFWLEIFLLQNIIIIILRSSKMTLTTISATWWKLRAYHAQIQTERSHETLYKTISDSLLRFLGSFLNQLPDLRVTFLESVGNFGGPGSCFMFDEFASKIKVPIILKTTQWNYQLRKQNWLVCELVNMCYSKQSYPLRKQRMD